MFRGRVWPEGFEFPACGQCNSGSSDDDLISSWLSYLGPNTQGEELKQGKGLMFQVGRQRRQLLQSMFNLSVTERRQKARDLGWTPAVGETYNDFPGVKVPPEVHAAVRVFAGKLTKALFWMHTGSIFPSDGGILFHWFTNANLLKDGRIPALEGFSQFSPHDVPLRRGGKDLTDQLDIRFLADSTAGLALTMAAFRRAFGFVTVGYVAPGAAAKTMSAVQAETGREHGAFELL